MIDQNLVYKYSKLVLVKLPSRTYLTTVYPNPANNRVNVLFRVVNTIQWDVAVTDFSGRVVQQTNWQPGQSSYSMPVQHLPAGMYILNMRSNEKISHTPFMVQH